MRDWRRGVLGGLFLDDVYVLWTTPSSKFEVDYPVWCFEVGSWPVAASRPVLLFVEWKSRQKGVTSCDTIYMSGEIFREGKKKLKWGGFLD